MRTRILTAREGEPIAGLSPADRTDLSSCINRLSGRLRPRGRLFEETTAGLVPRNIVGTIALNRRTTLSVLPKIEAHSDWIGACIDLMLPERAAIAGRRSAARGRSARSLEEGLAVIYRQRLERSLRSEGPIEVMHPEFARSSTLTGRLDVERWVLERPFVQQSFPVHRSVLDADNEFTAALSMAALILSRSVSDGTIRTALIRLAHEVRPGLPEPIAVDPGIVERPLPSQWSAFSDAWSIARVVLSQSGFQSRRGVLSGIEVALEPWVLLEELLDRTVRGVARLGQDAGLEWKVERQATVGVLDADEPSSAPLSRLLNDRVAHPENLLIGPEGVVASFEAKYSRPSRPEHIRQHMYQLLTTAAYAGSPCAILVYPELSEPIHWVATGKHTSVRNVYAVGLDLFGYSAHAGVGERAARVFQLLRGGDLPVAD